MQSLVKWFEMRMPPPHALRRSRAEARKDNHNSSDTKTFRPEFRLRPEFRRFSRAAAPFRRTYGGPLHRNAPTVYLLRRTRRDSKGTLPHTPRLGRRGQTRRVRGLSRYGRGTSGGSGDPSGGNPGDGGGSGPGSGGQPGGGPLPGGGGSGSSGGPTGAKARRNSSASPESARATATGRSRNASPAPTSATARATSRASNRQCVRFCRTATALGAKTHSDEPVHTAQSSTTEWTSSAPREPPPSTPCATERARRRQATDPTASGTTPKQVRPNTKATKTMQGIGSISNPPRPSAKKLPSDTGTSTSRAATKYARKPDER